MWFILSVTVFKAILYGIYVSQLDQANYIMSLCWQIISVPLI